MTRRRWLNPVTRVDRVIWVRSKKYQKFAKWVGWVVGGSWLGEAEILLNPVSIVKRVSSAKSAKASILK